MTIERKKETGRLTLAISGRLDTSTAPELEAALKSSLESVSQLIFDFEKLEYISSAGLRVLLTAHKTMNKQGSMKVINVCENVMEVFDITGFSDILTIEEGNHFENK